jgi:hypothetical protein
VDNAFGMHFFSSYQWKALLQVEAHLVTKGANRAGAGTIALFHPSIQYMLK